MQSMADRKTPTRPGYLVVQGVVTDREGFKAYSAALPPIYRKYGGEYLALLPAPLVEVAEGLAENRSIVLARFPSRQAARAFWDSPEYAAAKKLRELLLGDGVDLKTATLNRILKRNGLIHQKDSQRGNQGRDDPRAARSHAGTRLATPGPDS